MASGRDVVVESARVLDPWTMAAAALLASGPAAVITGVTAANLHGCRAVTDPATHVLLPYGRDVRRREGLVVHHGGSFAQDVLELDGIRVLPLDRVVADLLCTLRPQDALAVTDEVLRFAGDDADAARRRIVDRMSRRQDPRGTVRGAALLDLASPRSESPAESWLRWMILDRGFPIPEVNWSIRLPDGRELYRLDLAWPSCRIALEYDGHEAHAGREAQDEARVEDLRKRGWIVVRAGAADLRDLSRVTAELRAAFAQRGYTW